MFIVIARLDEESEIDAVLAGGISFTRLVAPLLAVGVALGIVSILLIGYLQPYSRFGYRAVLNAATDAGWTAQLDPQVFISAGPNFTITADEAVKLKAAAAAVAAAIAVDDFAPEELTSRGAFHKGDQPSQATSQPTPPSTSDLPPVELPAPEEVPALPPPGTTSEAAE